MKIKNVLLTGLSFVLVGAVAIGSTIAYLTSEDSDVNVMTLGNVKIEQHEYQRVVNADGTYATETIDNQTSYVLEKFVQSKPLLPIVGDPSLPGDNPEYAGYDNTVIRMSQVDSYGSAWVFAGKNAQDKLVTIENTGKSDAYIRTLIAYECGSVNSVSDFNKLVSTSEFKTNPGEVWTKSTVGIVNINGNNYVVVEFIYNGAKHLGGVHENGILPAGETSYPSLCQVYMKSSVTNEDCEALDGNANGTYDILVLTQAVQAEGFANAETALDTAFGDITTTNHPWSVNAPAIPTVVSTADELTTALANGGEVILTKDIDADADTTITIPAGVSTTLNLNGKTLDFVTDNADKNNDGRVTSADNEVAIDVRGTLNVKNGTITTKHTAENFAWNACTEVFYVAFNGTLNIENATIENLGGSDMAFAIDLVNATNVTLNISNSTIKSSYSPVRVFNNGSGMNNVTIKDNTLDGVSRAFWVHIYSNTDNGGRGVKDATLNLDIFGNGNIFNASNPNRIIEFGFEDEINFDANGNQL